uniref:(northern house mosquito) hypothetical protein n=1 Tax=Culex pipiens TaxID=7175 RepID=A0A8D7ZTS7_CULPI
MWYNNVSTSFVRHKPDPTSISSPYRPHSSLSPPTHPGVSSAAKTPLVPASTNLPPSMQRCSGKNFKSAHCCNFTTQRLKTHTTPESPNGSLQQSYGNNDLSAKCLCSWLYSLGLC